MSLQKNRWLKVALVFAVLFVAVARAQAGDIPPYDRSEWGGWPDEDGDCQDLRAELLIAQSRVPVTFRGGGACVVATGEWGGWAWTRKKKRAFASDTENLRIVSRSLNRAKGAKDPTQWLDVRPRFRAAYLATWRRVQGRYFSSHKTSHIGDLSK